MIFRGGITGEEIRGVRSWHRSVNVVSAGLLQNLGQAGKPKGVKRALKGRGLWLERSLILGRIEAGALGQRVPF